MNSPAAPAAVPARGRRLLPTWVRLTLLAVTVTAAAALAYSYFGSPEALSGDRDELSARLNGDASGIDAATAEHLYEQLQTQIRRHPDDARALVLKARLDMRSQRFEEAAKAFERAVQGNTRVARDAAVWAEYAEARGMLQGGTLVGAPQTLIDKALSIDATNQRALDLAGSAAWEQRDFAGAARYWKRLLEQIAPDSAQHVELSAAIERAEKRARFALPPAR